MTVIGIDIRGTTTRVAQADDVGSILAVASFATAEPETTIARIGDQVAAWGVDGDPIIGLSTSGNAADICAAAEVARDRGLKVLALTGADGGRLASLADVTVRVPATRVADVQELHLPVYHVICRLLERQFFTVSTVSAGVVE